MEEMIQVFLSTIRKQSHVLKLIENLDVLKIKLISDHAEEILVFHRGEVFVLVDNDESTEAYVISGQRNSIDTLLSGKEKLRNLIHYKKLNVTAPFRTILLIESIFYLTKPTKQLERSIS
jgi:hypothetical protein